jgi:hypothetical protein
VKTNPRLLLCLPLVIAASTARDFSREDPTQEPDPFRIDPSPFGDPILEMKGQSTTATATQTTKVFYFPPDPFTLGGPVTLHQSTLTINGKVFHPPAELASYVNEFFLPALGSRLASHNLGEADTTRLEAYRKTRDELAAELIQHLEAVQSLDPTKREAALREFAQIQTPRIAALERDAEEIRQQLLRTKWFEDSIDWFSGRLWRVGDANLSGYFAAAAEFQTVRASAFYRPGLSVDQRWLLREIAVEIRDAAPTGRSPLQRDAGGIFFLPDTGRVTFPPDLPAATAAKVDQFVRDKAALKQELRELVVAFDQKSTAERSKAFAALEDRQIPRRVALETLADEIRREVATLSVAPPAPALPAALVQKIENYKRDRVALNHELMQELRAHPTTLVSNQRPTLARDPFNPTAAQFDHPSPADVDRPHFPPLQNPSDVLADRAAEERAQITKDFQQANAGRYRALQDQLTAIREELSSLAAAQTDQKTGRPMTAQQLVDQFNLAARQFQTTGNHQSVFTQCQRAMLEPGLSPEQRRLLFVAGQPAAEPVLSFSGSFGGRIPSW